MMAEHGRQAELIADYVLGLLPAEEQAEVESHLADCALCREAAGRERALVAGVRKTVATATRPSGMRLRQLMPAAPAGRRRMLPLSPAVWRPVAALGMLLILLLGVLQSDLLGGHAGSDGILSSPSATTLIATATTTPTATQADSRLPEHRDNEDSGPALTTLVTSPPPMGTRLVALPAGKGNP